LICTHVVIHARRFISNSSQTFRLIISSYWVGACTARMSAPISPPSSGKSTSRLFTEVQGDDFRLEWEETGGPIIVGPPKTNGFGSVLAERSVKGQLGGKIEYDWQRGGLKFALTVPVGRLGS
jgi:two-component sensor histidine kinase